MMYALSFVLATTVAASSPTPAAGSGDAVVRIGPRSGKLQFQAFSRLTDPFGQFGSWRGEVKIPGGDLSRAEVMVRVELSTVDTQNAKRDAHLQNADFFNVPKWPVAVFTAKGLKPLGGDRYQVSGQLRMMGKSIPLTFPATVVYAGGKLSAKADFTLDRTLWGMTGYLSSFSMNPIKKGVRLFFDLKS